MTLILKDKGMTLLEIMVAMMIFSIGLLSLGMFIPYSTKKIFNANARTNSVTQAQRMVDEIAAEDWGAMDAYNGDVLDPIPGFDHYVAEMAVKFCTDSGDTLGAGTTDYKRIFVTITPRGGSESITMSTVVSQK